MSLDVHQVRSSADLRLTQTLSDHPRIRRAIRDRVHAEADRHLGIRRSLLAQSLRLTHEIAPTQVDLVRRSKDCLGIDMDVELYVFASPDYNAAMPRAEGDRTFVLLSSALFESFDDEELAYVVGHELGHHVYEHHSLPLEVLSDPEQPVPAGLALQLRAWQRYAEISADRAGVLCAGGLAPAARALFKLSSGLKEAPDGPRIAAYLAQAGELYREVEQSEAPILHRDWLASHPFSPVRLKAAEAFAHSTAFVDSGATMAALDLAVHDLMALMEPAYIDEDTEEAEHMRRVVFAGGILIANASDGISPEEIASLTSLLGPQRIPSSLSPAALRDDLPRRIAAARQKVRPARRAQVLRDLAVVARADGHVSPEELAELVALADALGVDATVVHGTLGQQVALD